VLTAAALRLPAGGLTSGVRVQIFSEYGQAGYAWNPQMAATPGPQLPAAGYPGSPFSAGPGNQPAPPGAGHF